MISKRLTINVVIGLCYIIFLLLLNAALEPDTAAHVFSESGPFEVLSFILWYLLAVTLVLVVRPLNRFVVFMAFLSFIAGCRELDMHNRFTQESISRISFYLNPDIFWLERLSATALVLALAGIATYCLYHFGKWLYDHPDILHPLGQITLLGIVMVPVTKILDRLPAYLSGFFGIAVSSEAADVMNALEEGLEMLLPILFLQALLMLPRNKPQPHRLGSRLYRVA
ncbi:MAG: hypothetical protein EA399_13765 [Desulfovibrionales bacterium]|nr:MAG: hypothetical protein EA399_13765 [Desulfovibrionales bacterium]